MIVRADADRDVSFAPWTLVQEARQRAGASEHEPLRFLQALARVSRSLDEEARLTPPGRRAVRQSLVSSLLIQFEVGRHMAEHPEIARQPLARPVFIIGLLRTGSTLVHNLLDQHPGLRCPKLWELTTPAGSRHVRHRESAVDATRVYVDDYNRIARDLPKIHFMNPVGADECHRLLVYTFMSRVYWLRFRVPGYAEWLAGQDLTDVYRYHRLLLQNILWRIPGEVPVLKCPFHVWSLSALVRVYPDARFVYLHRSPTAVVPSTCSLSAEVRSARSDGVDKIELGRFWLEHVEQAVAERHEVRRTHLGGRPVLDVTYRELMADPVGTMSRVCDFIGVPLTGAAARAMRGYLAENPQHKHGLHHYTPEEFGLRADDLDARFADYRREFDL
jgi:hypothetical protein